MHPKATTVQRICEECGATFERPTWRVLPGQARFCGRSCRTAHLRRGKRQDADARFWAKVVKTDSCWIFTGNLGESGHGRFWLEGRNIPAHHYLWVKEHGPIPNGKILCHDCPGGDNPACVRPDHLWIGTSAENSADMVRKGRSATGDLSPSRVYRASRPRGENHPFARFSDADVIEMRRLYAAGHSQRAISRQFETTQPVVQRIVNGKSR